MKRSARILLFLAVVLALAAGGMYMGARTGLTAGSEAPKLIGLDSVTPCDTDGVRISYSVSYDQAIAGYAVDSVRVLGIAPRCSGQRVEVVLRGPGGAPVGGATGTGIVNGSGAELVLGDNVAAAQVRSVHVALGGGAGVDVCGAGSGTHGFAGCRLVRP